MEAKHTLGPVEIDGPYTEGVLIFASAGDPDDAAGLSIVVKGRNREVDAVRIATTWNAHDALMAAVAWQPIEQFDFAKDAQCRLVWMLAKEDLIIGECYFGHGPMGHPLLCPDPARMAWRYARSNEPLGNHITPTHFRPRMLTPKEVAAIAGSPS